MNYSDERLLAWSILTLISVITDSVPYRHTWASYRPLHDFPDTFSSFQKYSERDVSFYNVNSSFGTTICHHVGKPWIVSDEKIFIKWLRTLRCAWKTFLLLLCKVCSAHRSPGNTRYKDSRDPYRRSIYNVVDEYDASKSILKDL